MHQAVLTLHEETTLTRNLRPLIDSGWVAFSTGEDRREKLVRLTEAGAAKLEEAGPAWERAESACGHACRRGPGRASLPPSLTLPGWPTRRNFLGIIHAYACFWKDSL